MQHNILLTGASGYLGGTLLARWQSAELKSCGKLFALVRKTADAAAVKEYGAEPLTFDVSDEASVKKALLEHDVTIVIHNINAFDPKTAVNFIKALAEVKNLLECDVHLIHSSGSKLFSSHAGAPQEGIWSDDSVDIYETQQAQKALHPTVQRAVDTNNTIVGTASSLGVREYMVIPCIVYGKGEGFGNPISIQTQAIVKVAKALGKMCRITQGNSRWPVSHITDTVEMYFSILRRILSGSIIDSNEKGYYHTAAGRIAWDDLYAAMATALVKMGHLQEASVHSASEEDIERMADALQVPKELVELQIGGNCILAADHGSKIGWKPQYSAEHIFDSAEDEVTLILAHLERA